MKIQAPAKLNLYLEVTGNRPDGYHLLESDVVFLNLCDELEFEPSETLSLNSDIADNIIIKAARALSPDKGVKITLTKNIPMGAGLGGGSADAAATLVALNEMWGINMPEKLLYAIALSLGADVPVCLFSQLNDAEFAHFSGIGNEVSFTETRPDWSYLLVNPNKHLATKDVFESYNSHFTELAKLPHTNHLEAAAIRLEPEIAEILATLHGSTNNLFARMTGSGSTCFAVFERREDAENAAKNLPEKWWRYIAQTI